MGEEFKIQKKTLKKIVIFGALLVIIVMGFFSVKTYGSSQGLTGNVVKQINTGDVQNIKVRMSGGQYIFDQPELKKDIPVRMEFDLSTVNGCYRSVVIPAFNIRKYLQQGDNIIEFTPTKAGTFGITCSMGMGRGTFKVLESSGAPSTYIDTSAQQKANTGGSCGVGGGGCGCGG